jgi:dTDP-4-amino-4,6-dideoxygalactose transaminase
MKILHKTIFTGFFPNTRPRDVAIALRYLLFPFGLTQGKYLDQVTQKISSDMNNLPVILTNTGSDGIYMVLDALDLKEGDEVLVQAFTCVVVINAIKWAGATPVFVDVLPDATMDPVSAAQQITPHTKAMLIQHTFGTPAQLNKLMQLAKKHQLVTIEDCAHVYKGKDAEGRTLGTVADVAMLSFGSDKPISCVRGGALVCRNEALGTILKQAAQKNQVPLPRIEILRRLFTLVLFYLMKPVYHLGIGKIVLYLAKKYSLSQKIITQAEKQGIRDRHLAYQFPNALAHVLVDQLKHADNTNAHRKKIAEQYDAVFGEMALPRATQTIPLRYSMLVTDRDACIAQMRAQGLIAGNWYHAVVAPSDADLAATGYKQGSCPNAEELTTKIFNLPTHIGMNAQSLQRVIRIVQHACSR